MATKAKKPAAKKATPAAAAKVTRIKASEPTTRKKPTSKVIVTDKSASSPDTTSRVTALSVLRSIGGYFKGAWYELRQVRWPNRKATWGLTAAVLIFTAFFVVLIVLLDILFKYLFELILG